MEYFIIASVIVAFIFWDVHRKKVQQQQDLELAQDFIDEVVITRLIIDYGEAGIIDYLYSHKDIIASNYEQPEKAYCYAYAAIFIYISALMPLHDLQPPKNYNIELDMAFRIKKTFRTQYKKYLDENELQKDLCESIALLRLWLGGKTYGNKDSITESNVAAIFADLVIKIIKNNKFSLPQDSVDQLASIFFLTNRKMDAVLGTILADKS